MLAIILDWFAAIYLRKHFSTKLQYFFMGVLVGAINSAISAYIVGTLLNDKPGQIVISGLTGAIYHPLLIFFFIFLQLRKASKKAQKEAAVSANVAANSYWDANESLIIKGILKENEHIDLDTAERNLSLEENLSNIPTEDIIKNIQKNYYSEEAIPSVLRSLKSRLNGK